MDATQLAQYNQTMNSAPSGSIAMTAGGANQGLSEFLNSPEYTALYGSNAAQQLATTGNYNPTQSFQQDPGFQYNINQALSQVNNASAAKGLLESSATQTGLLNTAQGLQNQGYQTWLGQQNTLFNQYQGQLASLTSLGAANTGSTNANTNGQQLSSTLSNANLGTAQNISNANQATGANISSIQANQGVFDANANLNTTAAQANNIFQGNAFQAQIDANANASQAQAINGQNAAQGQSNVNNGMFANSNTRPAVSSANTNGSTAGLI